MAVDFVGLGVISTGYCDFVVLVVCYLLDWLRPVCWCLLFVDFVLFCCVCFVILLPWCAVGGWCLCLFCGLDVCLWVYLMGWLLMVWFWFEYLDFVVCLIFDYARLTCLWC